MNSLKSLSDKALVRELHKLIRQEKQLTLRILPHLAEVDRRELYMKWGFSSLTDYCVSHLGYCESSAGRRVCAARVIRRFPEVYGLLESGRVTFSAVIAASSALAPHNKAELLERISGKSQGEVRLIVAEYKPPAPIRDQARPTMVMKVVPRSRGLALSDVSQAAASAGVSSDDAGARPLAKLGEIPTRSEGKEFTSVNNPTPLESHAQSGVVRMERMYDIRFAGDDELIEMMAWLRSHLSGRSPQGASYLELFKWAIGYVREREDLAKRAERRKQRQKRKKQQPKPPRNTEKRGVPFSRHIAAKEKEKVWIRDKGRCAYKGPDGRTCNSTRNLQYDHYPIPFARGGPSTADNLRLLCAIHNRLDAERVYGKQHMDRFRRRE
jgi:5-methylcytosine-specific restriction endonuclease McrA